VRILKKATVSTLCTVALVVGSTLPAQASLSQPAVVSDNPADTTPHVLITDTSVTPCMPVAGSLRCRTPS
jgi:hypothetical protein